MSGTLGRYHFLAWAQQGISATLANPDHGGTLPARGVVNVGLTVNAEGPKPDQQSIKPVPVQVFGPGDVLGIDPRHVVRTEPRDATTNFEPNYLAGIEFDASRSALAVHAGRTGRGPLAALVSADRAEIQRIHRRRRHPSTVAGHRCGDAVGASAAR